MTDLVSAAVEGVTRTWKEEAERRRGITKFDPIADTLEYCAGEIAARLKTVLRSAQHLTVDEYAKREGVTPQTVRNWIRSDRLPALDTSKGYRIPADAALARRTA